MSAALQLSGVTAGYFQAPVLREVDMHVDAGEVVCVIGSNGAGKSTLLRAISAMTPWRRGEIVFDGKALDRHAYTRSGLGIAHVPEGRWMFPELSVADHLHLGAYSLRSFRQRRRIHGLRNQVLDLFPILAERLSQRAGTLSGGQQAMLAIARALMSEPKLLMLDEPSLGLAPKVVEDIFAKLRVLQEQGTTILLVEQNARIALAFSDRGYVLESGRVTLEGPARELAGSDEVRDRYLGKRAVAAPTEQRPSS